MMKIKEIKDEILLKIGNSINKDGFLLNKKDEIFERRVLDNTDCFYILFSDYGKKLIVEPWWGIRNDVVADIYNRITEKLPAYYHLSEVLGNNLGRLKDFLDNGHEKKVIDTERHVIQNRDDIDKIVGLILSDFRTYLLPYFAEHHSVESFNEVLNLRHIRDLIVHNFDYPSRAMMGLITAKLSSNALYTDLEGIYSEELQEASPDSKLEFERLKTLLRQGTL